MFAQLAVRKMTPWVIAADATIQTNCNPNILSMITVENVMQCHNWIAISHFVKLSVYKCSDQT
jgi:hypothetical protein